MENAREQDRRGVPVLFRIVLRMITSYPFRLHDHLIRHLPDPGSDGLCDIDIM